MNKYLLFGIPCAISGSILYVGFNKINRQSSYYPRKSLLNVRTYINPGLFIGLSIGWLRAYLNKPIIYSLINTNKEII